jgi:hypothetical protein
MQFPSSHGTKAKQLLQASSTLDSQCGRMTNYQLRS